LPYSWEQHLFSGSWMEFAVSPEVNINAFSGNAYHWSKHGHRLLPIGYVF